MNDKARQTLKKLVDRHGPDKTRARASERQPRRNWTRLPLFMLILALVAVATLYFTQRSDRELSYHGHYQLPIEPIYSMRKQMEGQIINSKAFKDYVTKRRKNDPCSPYYNDLYNGAMQYGIIFDKAVFSIMECYMEKKDTARAQSFVDFVEQEKIPISQVYYGSYLRLKEDLEMMVTGRDDW